MFVFVQVLPHLPQGGDRCASARSRESIDSIHSVHSEYTDQVKIFFVLLIKTILCLLEQSLFRWNILTPK